MEQKKVLVDVGIKRLLQHYHILENMKCSSDDDDNDKTFDNFIQPTSLDLPLSTECVQTKDKILPFDINIRDVLPSLTLQHLNLAKPCVLLKGQTYLVFISQLRLPANVSAILSPKSSIGRIDVMVRAIISFCGFYDTIAIGSQGELWLEITPRSFNIRLQAGMALTQMMFFLHSPLFTPNVNTSVLFAMHNQYATRSQFQYFNGALVLHIDINLLMKKKEEETGDVVGHEALDTNEVLNLVCKKKNKQKQTTATDDEEETKTECYDNDPAKFFRPLLLQKTTPNNYKEVMKTERDSVVLEKDKFYILATKEKLSIPLYLSAEMTPFSHNIGEFRAHFAGFFDSGFGLGSQHGTVAVLEVRPHETIRLYDNQPIALMKFYINNTYPTHGYNSTKTKNHYQFQSGPQLSKYFL